MSTRTMDYEIPVASDRRVCGSITLPPQCWWPAPVVLFCHGFKGFKDWGAWPRFAESLAARGYLVNRMTFSLAGVSPRSDRQDEPEKFARNTYGAELEDIVATLAERERWGVPVGALGPGTAIVGHSRGGMTALFFAAEAGLSHVQAIVSMAAPADPLPFSARDLETWRRTGRLPVFNARTQQELYLDRSVLDDYEQHQQRYDFIRALGTSAVPTLVLHGDADVVVPVAAAHTIHTAILRAPRRLTILPGANHTFGAAHPGPIESPELTRALDCAVDWLEEYVPR
ncbi:MAG: alpha/beta hydrolase family protein [Planctomycetota bacterium]